ncbi:MAG: hypothetical protein WKF73_10950 [Nocardioidaceae bacterium]
MGISLVSMVADMDHTATPRHQPWGFELDPMQVPVANWQGREDRMVPYDHGVWLADHVAGATSHLYPEEGHVSLIQRIADILDNLVKLSAVRS